ncbi:hypothetical protein MY9_0451 [Bacillus sp. JS]|nr:hypothetical protein MY9_0451 [Bacillus sp. JS]
MLSHFAIVLSAMMSLYAIYIPKNERQKTQRQTDAPVP